MHKNSPLENQVACHFKGPRGPKTPASPPAKEEILFAVGPHLAETAANATARNSS